MKFFAFNFCMNHFRCAFSTEDCKEGLHRLIEIRMATSLRRASGPYGESLESFRLATSHILCLHDIMFQATLSRAAQASSSAVRTAINNPYKAQKQWPPDFTKLSTKHQFRFERRYRRRAKLKWARPRWMKITKIAQWGLPSCKYDLSLDSPTLLKLILQLSLCTQCL